MRDYILSVVAEATVTSPLATIEELHTDTISPLSPESPGITVPLGDTQTFAVTDAEGTPTTSFDSVGNATIAGTLTVSQDATIAGTLYADRIVTGEGEITPSTESATFVTNVTNVTYATPAGELATTSALFALGATVSGDGGSHIQISKDVTLTSSLAVFGETLLGTTAIAGGIDIDGTVHIGTNGIESFGDTLYIQRSKLANLDIMDGVLVITAAGNVFVNGNLTVTGVLGANTIAPNDANDLVFDISRPFTAASDSTSASESGTPTSEFAKLLIRGANGAVVGSVDASGNAAFANQLTSNSLLVQDEASIAGQLALNRLLITSQTQDDALTASASANETATIGRATILPGQRAITIANARVTDGSLIYVTPITSTGNQVLYVGQKTPGVSFTVGMDAALSTPVEFNWWIIN